MRNSDGWALHSELGTWTQTLVSTGPGQILLFSQQGTIDGPVRFVTELKVLVASWHGGHHETAAEGITSQGSCSSEATAYAAAFHCFSCLQSTAVQKIKWKIPEVSYLQSFFIFVVLLYS